MGLCRRLLFWTCRPADKSEPWLVSDSIDFVVQRLLRLAAEADRVTL
jgi:hypothetical protein